MPRSRILIVEDDPGVRFGIREFLAAKGYETEEAASCEEALEAFRAAQPDVVVTDYRLPDANALQLLPDDARILDDGASSRHRPANVKKMFAIRKCRV